MSPEPRIDYDAEQDIMFYNAGRKVKDSLDVGNIVVDFDYRGKVVGVEILDATGTLSDLVDADLDADLLASVQDAEVKVYGQQGFAYIVIVLTFAEDRTEHVNVSLPQGAMAPATA